MLKPIILVLLFSGAGIVRAGISVSLIDSFSVPVEGPYSYTIVNSDLYDCLGILDTIRNHLVMVDKENGALKHDLSLQDTARYVFSKGNDIFLFLESDSSIVSCIDNYLPVGWCDMEVEDAGGPGYFCTDGGRFYKLIDAGWSSGIYRIDTVISFEGLVTYTAGIQCGLTYSEGDAGYLWYVSTGGGAHLDLYKPVTDPAQIPYGSCGLPVLKPKGIAADGEDFWVYSATTELMYRGTISVTGVDDGFIVPGNYTDGHGGAGRVLQFDILGRMVQDGTTGTGVIIEYRDGVVRKGLRW